MATTKVRRSVYSNRYSGGHEKAQFSPWVYAIHDVTMNRQRTLALYRKFLPVDKIIPQAILDAWMREVEDGTIQIAPKFRDWVRRALEAEAISAIRDALIANAQASKAAAEAVVNGKMPVGGVVGMKYPSDAVYVLGNTYKELTRGTQIQMQNVNKFVMNFGDKPQKKIARVIEGEAKVLPSGDN